MCTHACQPRAYHASRLPHQVKPGKGPAFVRTKLKNIETRATLDKTWRAGESYPDADVDKQIMQYSYIDGDDHVFMNMGMHTHGARTTWRKPHDMHICMHMDMELEPRTNRPDYPADTLARPDYNRPGLCLPATHACAPCLGQPPTRRSASPRPTWTR